MPKVIHARYEKGVLKPLEPLELDNGEEVVARAHCLGYFGFSGHGQPPL